MQKTKRIYISYAKIKTICIPSAKNKKNLHCPCKKLKTIYIAHAKMKKKANCKFFLFFAFLM